MNTRTLVARSLRFYWRTHLGVVAGAAVASAVLVGALLVGDSIRHSLRSFALLRLGRVSVAMAPRDRYFRDPLADEMGAALDAPTAAALSLRGMAVGGDGQARANRVHVLGVAPGFWRLGGCDDPLVGAAEDSVVLNTRLAARLGTGVGDTVLIRVERPSLLPRDAPLATVDDAAAASRLTVAAIATDAQFGRFGLQADQLAPLNAFVPLAWLQAKVDLPARANLLLVGSTVDAKAANARLHEHWRLADAALELRQADGVMELCTDRVFLDAPVADAALEAMPQAYGVLTYFVNELRAGNRSTPYSIVAAVGRGELAPQGMKDDKVLVNAWLAADLGIKAGDTVALTYFVVGARRSLTERTSRFRVRDVVPIEGAAADRTLMPEFPGVAEAKNCRDWEPGIPIDLSKIRKKDEAYWEQYRGTPKAFVSLATAQRMWGNRFGDLTAVRYPLDAGPKEKLAAAIRARLDPASLGLFFRPVREQALAAATQALDFGQLFIGLSFFLIVAALLLTGLLFVFGIEHRTAEVGTLLAVGYRPRDTRRLLLAEGGVLAVAGGVVGAACGTLYTRLVLHGLTTVWGGAVAGTPVLHFHAEPTTLVIGAAASIAVALVAMALVLRRQVRRPARELLTGTVGADHPTQASRGRATLWLGVGAVAAALAIVAWAGASQDKAAAAAFFGSGALVLTGGLCLCSTLLAGLGRGASTRSLSLRGLGTRNAARRRGRSLAVVGLLACGTFLVVAVGANRRDPGAGAHTRASGTGGFALVGESALPVYQDLNSKAGREAFGLEAAEMAGVRVVPLRVRDGDDASCLNLNRAQAPRLLGVDPEALRSRKAFTFVRPPHGESPEELWMQLACDYDDDTVLCIGDEPTAVWGLDKGLGDELTYADERGRQFKLHLAAMLGGSVLQGSLLISETAFERRFPSESGYRMFLIDAPPGRVDAVAKALSRALSDVGLELTPTAERLAELGAVENTYLSMFQVLGGLGLLLGSVGLGLVVLRNVLERRSELALLRAVGFGRGALRRLVLAEHWGLLALGLVCGVVAALVAVLPALRSPGAGVPYGSLALTLAAIAASGLAWTWLAAAWALRSPLLSALRNE